MAKILYSVCGVGLGHASRSSIILKELMKSHEVKIVSYQDGLNFLSKEFPKQKIEELRWFDYSFNGYKINKLWTAIKIAPRFYFVYKYNRNKLEKIIEEFQPNIIISDFDINALLMSRKTKIPCILLSNLHLIEYFKPKMSFWEKLEFQLTDERMLKTYKNAKAYIIISIKKLKDEGNRFFFYPIVGKEIINAKPKEKNYFHVYFAEHALNEMIPLLKQLPFRFIVYGKNENRIDENLEFKKFARWTQNIANCKGLLCHGGMLTISEAVVLKKPIYVFATKDWFERFHNGYMIEREGFGLLEEKPSLAGLQKFFSNLELYKANLRKASIKPENEKIIKKVEALIKALS